MSKYVEIEQKNLLIIATVSFVLGILDIVLDFRPFDEFMTACGIFLLLFGILLFHHARYDKVERKGLLSLGIAMLVFGILQFTGTARTLSGFMLISGLSLCFSGVFLIYLIEKQETKGSIEEKPQLRR